MGTEPDSDEWAVNPLRDRILEWLLERDGALYRWNGKGETPPDEEWERLAAWAKVHRPDFIPPRCRQVFDCSGLVVCSLIEMAGAPEGWRHAMNADALFHKLDEVDYQGAAPLDLAFWGRPPENGNPKQRATHVMFLLRDGRVFGACGGNQSTLTLETAVRVNAAQVQFRSSHQYRTDFLGFRRLPV